MVCPSNAYEAKGLLIQAIRDDDPVIFCEHKNLYSHECEVPEESYAIPFGEANIVREGKDVTIVSYGQTLHRAMAAADSLARKDRVEAEVIDLRTLSPIDLDEANPRCSIASDVSAYVAQHAFGALKAAPQMVTSPHAPAPFSPSLEDLYVPSVEAVVAAVGNTIARAKAA